MKIFSLSRLWLSLIPGCISLLLGCATASHSTPARTQLTISVSGTASALFTATYDFAGLKGTVSTAANPNPTPVLEGTIVGDGYVEVRKQDASQQLTVDIYEGKRHPVHLVAPSGMKAARAVRRGPGWQVESL